MAPWLNRFAPSCTSARTAPDARNAIIGNRKINMRRNMAISLSIPPPWSTGMENGKWQMANGKTKLDLRHFLILPFSIYHFTFTMQECPFALDRYAEDYSCHPHAIPAILEISAINFRKSSNQ